ncbi:hypothetical protein NP493_85g03000 [Ridgeia piscesae]|uniref:PDZ domain-containing protein n=1 Tax=Ridgeia piscesae TaxID=27915 RepID=A0AAD9P8Q1_RIDPI|nr:hypothetical protein NP493_85g03000 [Ridgeia piscesae]
MALRLCPDTITDSHPNLRPLCETLEVIFRKGIQQSSTIFGRTRRDYWNWVESFVSANASKNRANPVLAMTVDTVKSSKFVCTKQGRGRYFIRLALQKKVLATLVEQLIRQSNILVIMNYYDGGMSIISHEILGEIFLSLLFEIREIKFQLKTQNASFLDDTWLLPIYKEYEFVPCTKLGIHVQHVDGHILTMKVDKGSIAEEDDKICAGDVMVELFGESLKNVPMGKIGSQLRGNQGYPIKLAVVKCRLVDDSVFPPIAAMLKKCRENPCMRDLLDEEKIAQTRRYEKIPPHAQLPEDECPELPVHNAADMAEYRVKYLGEASSGNRGGVDEIDSVIRQVISATKESTQEDVGDVILQLGETQVIVVAPTTGKEIVKHSFTEVSCCGRGTEQRGVGGNCFTYLAG